MVIKGEFLAITDYICILHHRWTDKDVNHNLTVWLRQNNYKAVCGRVWSAARL